MVAILLNMFNRIKRFLTAEGSSVVLALVVLGATIFAHTVSAAEPTGWVAQKSDPHAARIEWNPCRGLVPFTDGLDSKFPHSLVFDYLPLRSVVKSADSIDWAALEKQLQRQSQAGCQAVVRFYLDYPNMAAGTPQFLIDDGVAMRDYDEYSNGARARSQSPDWNDDKVVAACERFIAAFGSVYDGDPRIGIVQLGLYGFWGEWHTYPYEGSSGHPDWQMSAENKVRLLTAYKKAFPKTQLCLRNPAGIDDPDLKAVFGYHDDSFAWRTVPSKPEDTYHFWRLMEDAGLQDQWKRRSMGGELRPELQEQKYWAHWPNTVGEDWATCVRTVHVSWMLCASVFSRSMNAKNPLTPEEWDNALRGHELLGYQLFVSQVRLPNVSGKGTLEAEIKIKNLGVAPPPYSWPARFAVLNADGKRLAGPWENEVDLELPKILPGASEYLRTFRQENAGLAPGKYTLLLQLRPPLPNQQIVFANARMHENLSGWLTLGDFEVEAEK